MAFKTTRDQRAQRWRIVPSLIAATFAFSACQFVCASGSMAQIKAPNKNHLKAPTKSTSTAPSEDVQPFAIGTDGSVADQLTALKIDPSTPRQRPTPSPRRWSSSTGRPPTRAARSWHRRAPTSPSAWSPCSSIPPSRWPWSCIAAPTAATASSWRPTPPRTTTSASPAFRARPRPLEHGARSVVAGSVALVKVSASSGLATSLASTGASSATLKELSEALAGFTGAKVEVWKGRTVDGAPRLLAAAIGEGSAKQSFWWFAPPNEPEGWFDEQGRQARRHGTRRSPAAARASPRRSAFAATTAARAAAASTTASISRARPACRSMRQPTARSITRAGTSTTAAR